MIDLLILVQSLLLVALATARAPQDVPLVAVSRAEAVLLQDRSCEFVVESDHLVQQLRILDVVGLLVAVVGGLASDHLLVCDVLEMKELALILILLVVKVLARVRSLREEASLA